MREVVLSGLLIPWKDDQPVFLMMPMSDALYLPLFETAEEMAEKLAGIAEYDGIKVVEEGCEFLYSLPRMLGDKQIKVILNLRPQPDGRLRFTEVKSN